MIKDRSPAIRDALADLRTSSAGALGDQDSRRLTRADLQPVLGSLGITRVGDLTGLDVLSIPVWFASRPMSRSLCVSNGKGLTTEWAWTSAVMESAEQAIAERAGDMIAIVDSPSGLARRGLRGIPLDRQSRCGASMVAADAEMAWVEGLSWMTGEPVYAPYELVGVDMTSDAPWNHDAFIMTSTGLASSGNLAGAILHGLEELIEDDAIFASVSGAARRAGPVEFSTVHTGLAKMIATLAAREVECLFADMTDDIDHPVMMAALRPLAAGEPRHSYFGGYACRRTREEAALAALLEAVQSRLTFVSGARDDLFAEEYRDPLRPATEAAFAPCTWTDAGVALASQRSPLREVADKITALGLDIYVFPLGGRDLGFEVVRVLADDLVSADGASLHPKSGRAGDKLLRAWMQG